MGRGDGRAKRASCRGTAYPCVSQDQQGGQRGKCSEKNGKENSTCGYTVSVGRTQQKAEKERVNLACVGTD